MKDAKTVAALLPAVSPALFVLLWSTGFIGAKLGLPHAEPFTFLLIRMILVCGLMAAISLAWRAPWPQRTADWLHIALAGVLVHAVYLGGVFSAIHAGLPAGVTALITGLQPLLTGALVGPLLGEKVKARQWGGLALGFLGVALVVSPKLGAGPGSYPAIGLVWAFAAVLGITFGTVYQKKFCTEMDLRSGAAIQFGATMIAMALLAFALETREVAWTGEFVFALAWLTLVLSVGAITLLNRLIRVGAAARVASFFYLVPPVTAIMAYLLFGESLTPAAVFGMGLAAGGVALVIRT